MTQKRGVLFAILAAAFYALNSPLSKLLLAQTGPTMKLKQKQIQVRMKE